MRTRRVIKSHFKEVKEAMIELIEDGPPTELTSLDHWVLWRNDLREGKKTKVPYYVNGGLKQAKSTDPTTWTGYNTAVQQMREYKMAGVGFCFKDSGYAGVDFDGCRDPRTGEIDDWALTEIQKLNSYTEVSPSGTGVKTFVRGKLPGSGKRKEFEEIGHGGKVRAIEIYDTGRYFTVTGNLLPDYPLHPESRNLDELYHRLCSSVAKSAVLTTSSNGNIPEGKRSDTIFRKACGLRNKGFSQSAILAAMLVFNREECKPPLSDAEVEKQVNGAVRYPQPVAMPVEDLETRADMPEEVLDGRLGEIYQRKMKGCCLAYAWPSLLVIAGASPFLKFDDNKIRANLFSCLVGPTDTGKSSTFDQARYVLGSDHTDPIILSAKYGSGEALMQELDKVNPSTRLLYPDELKHLLIKAGLEGASFPTLLTTAFYQDHQRGGTKKKSKDAVAQFEVDCRLSIAGGVVEEDFGDCFGSASVSGLYDRFIFGLCPIPCVYQWRPTDSTPEKLSVFPPRIHANVWDERDQWVKDGISPRVAELGLRCAYICAAANRRDELKASDLGPALAFARYQRKFRSVMQPNPGQNPVAQCAIKVREWLKQHHPGEWIRRWELSKGIHSERLGPKVFNETLTNLAMTGDIEAQDKLVRLLPH